MHDVKRSPPAQRRNALFILFRKFTTCIYPVNSIITSMRLEAIKVFCDLIGSGSFSKAAEANELSQPTVSRFVHQLEDRLGGQLVDRSKRPLQPTALGQAYYEGCKKLLE